MRAFLQKHVVLLLALGLIALGAGSLMRSTTAAFFTATASTTATFSTQSISFAGTINGDGTNCTPNSGNTFSASCSSIFSASNMVPGESRFGRVSLQNTNSGGASGGMALRLGSALASGSNLLAATTAPAGTATDPLGLLVFRCTVGGTPADCGTSPGAGSHITITPVYPSASACSNGSGGALASFDLSNNTALTNGSSGLIFTKASTAEPYIYIRKDNTVDLTSSAISATPASYYRCTGGPATTSTDFAFGGPNTLPAGVSYPSGAAAQIDGGVTDYLGVIAYLPTSSANSLQNLTASITLSWTAEQRVSQFAQ